MRRRRQRSGVAFAVVAVVVLAACTGGEDSSTSAVTLSGSGAFDPDREGPAAAIAGAVEGGTVTGLAALDQASAAYEFSTLDPSAIWGTGPALSIMRGLVTRSLTQYVYGPEQGSMVLVPDLATDLGRPNEDFTEWRYEIRDGVRFEDGTEVTADDVAYGIKRSFDRPTFKDAPAYSNEFFVDGDTYQGPYTSGTDYKGVVVEGDTVILTMDRPFPDMPYWGSFPAMGPIPERGSSPPGYGRHPLATGPYKFEQFTPKESLTLVRNEEWDPDTDPGRHAYPDRYEFRFTERQERVEALILGDSEQGQTAMSIPFFWVQPEDLAEARDLGRLVVGPGRCIGTWNLDNRKIQEIEVRQAVGYAYPYVGAARARGLVPGVTAVFGTSILPLGHPGRQDYNPLETEPGETDPDKAKELLREAGYAPGEYELSWASRPGTAVPEELLVRSLEAAGFKAAPFPVSDAAWADVQYDPDAPINVRIAGWCPDWPSGANWFPALFQSDTKMTDAAYFDDPGVDAEIERIQRLPFEDQPAAWGALDKNLMTEHYPVVVTEYDGVPVLHGSRIGGVNVDSITDTPTWKDLHVIP